MANDVAKLAPLTVLEPNSITELMQLAQTVANSEMVPDTYKNKPADVLVAFLMGRELGLKYMQALEGICVINGRPTLWGKVARGLVMASGLVEDIHETDPEEVANSGKARCVIKRKGVPKEFVGTFSLKAAEKAGLVGKDNYKKYPADMLIWRAFHRAALKAVPEVYHGLEAAEEAIDVTPPKEYPPNNYPTGGEESGSDPSHQPASDEARRTDPPPVDGSMAGPEQQGPQGDPPTPPPSPAIRGGGSQQTGEHQANTTAVTPDSPAAGKTITEKQQFDLIRAGRLRGYNVEELEDAIKAELGCDIDKLTEAQLEHVYEQFSFRKA